MGSARRELVKQISAADAAVAASAAARFAARAAVSIPVGSLALDVPATRERTQIALDAARVAVPYSSHGGGITGAVMNLRFNNSSVLLLEDYNLTSLSVAR